MPRQACFAAWPHPKPAHPLLLECRAGGAAGCDGTATRGGAVTTRDGKATARGGTRAVQGCRCVLASGQAARFTQGCGEVATVAEVAPPAVRKHAGFPGDGKVGMECKGMLEGKAGVEAGAGAVG
eukprot:1149058-Pelagomonas_calceolata.AAC.8